MRLPQDPQVRALIVFMPLTFILRCAGNYIFPPGQDGNIFSAYYDNWLEPWSNGQYLAAYMAQWPIGQSLVVQPKN